MTGKHLLRALTPLLLLLLLLLPGAGSAENTPRVTLLSPGEASRVLSPIQISAEIRPEAGGLARLELRDRQGKAISRQLIRLVGDENGDPVPFTAKLPFEIPADEQEALLTLSLLDPFFRPIALRSAQITLLSGGDAHIEPYDVQAPWVTLTSPEPMDIFTGGQVTVAGAVTPLTDNPVILELTADDGRVIGTAQVRVEAPGQAIDFETTLPYYYIKTFTDARLVVRQNMDPYNTPAILDSTLIGVAP